MKVRLISFSNNFKQPERAHYNDAGLDCFAAESKTLQPGERARIHLGFGLELPDGYVALLLPRSSLNAKGIDIKTGTIDSGYRGELQAVVHNHTGHFITIDKDMKICQLVVMPIIYIEPVLEDMSQRLDGGFGSTGK